MLQSCLVRYQIFWCICALEQVLGMKHSVNVFVKLFWYAEVCAEVCVKQHQVVWSGYGLHEHFNDHVWSKWEKLKAMDMNWWQKMTKLPFISIIWHLLHLWAWIHLTMYEQTKQCHFYLLVCNLTNFYKRTFGLERKRNFYFY